MEPVPVEAGFHDTAQRHQQELYEGLLEKSVRQKQKKKKAEVNADQISFFDLVA